VGKKEMKKLSGNFEGKLKNITRNIFPHTVVRKNGGMFGTMA